MSQLCVESYRVSPDIFWSIIIIIIAIIIITIVIIADTTTTTTNTTSSTAIPCFTLKLQVSPANYYFLEKDS